MKFQVSVPEDLSILLRELASREHRPIRHQAEYLLNQAIKLAALCTNMPKEASQECATDALIGATHE
jgi:hypothetical protein